MSRDLYSASEFAGRCIAAHLCTPMAPLRLLPGASPAGLNMYESQMRSYRVTMELFRPGAAMFDLATTALLRAVLEEVCKSVSEGEIGVRTHVASKILEAATKGEISPERLRQVGRDAISHAPTMWR